MKKEINYYIIIQERAKVFEEQVKLLLDRNYELVGGPFIKDNCFCQAVLSYKESTKILPKSFIETTVIPELQRRKLVNIKCACYSSEIDEELDDLIIWFKKNLLNDKPEVSGIT